MRPSGRSSLSPPSPLSLPSSLPSVCHGECRAVSSPVRGRGRAAAWVPCVPAELPRQVGGVQGGFARVRCSNQWRWTPLLKGCPTAPPPLKPSTGMQRYKCRQVGQCRSARTLQNADCRPPPSPLLHPAASDAVSPSADSRRVPHHDSGGATTMLYMCTPCHATAVVGVPAGLPWCVTYRHPLCHCCRQAVSGYVFGHARCT